MGVRSMLVTLATTALVTAGLAVPATHAAGTPGITDFGASGPARCTSSLPDTAPFDATIAGAGNHPASVTVGEAITVNFTGFTVPGGYPNLSFNTAYLHIDGPVSPRGDFILIGPPMFKATGPGTVTITLVSTSAYSPRSPVGPFNVNCSPASGTPIVLSTFTATTKPVCFGLPATIAGTIGNDTLRGTTGPDVIVARDGDDTIYGNGGDDTICGDHGNDHINAGAGADRVDGGYADDVVDGQAGDDVILGGSGKDVLSGGNGADVIDGGVGADTCSGEQLVNC